MVDEKEAAMLRAFTALEGVNAAGKMELKQIKACSLASNFISYVRDLQVKWCPSHAGVSFISVEAMASSYCASH